MTDIILAVICFTLVAIVLAVVASKNKLIPPAAGSAVMDEIKSIESHNFNVLANLKLLWTHTVQWLEIYYLVPICIVLVYGAASLVLHMTGYKPTTDVSMLADVAIRLPVLAAVLAFVTITHQQTSAWLTKEEMKANVPLAIAHEAKIVILFLVIAYAIHVL